MLIIIIILDGAPLLGRESQAFPSIFAYGCMYVCVCVRMCVYVCLYLCVCACMGAIMCALPSLWLSLRKKIEFHGHAIPGAFGVACGAIPDDNADASHRYKGHT